MMNDWTETIAKLFQIEELISTTNLANEVNIVVLSAFYCVKHFPQNNNLLWLMEAIFFRFGNTFVKCLFKLFTNKLLFTTFCHTLQQKFVHQTKFGICQRVSYWFYRSTDRMFSTYY